jgi:hypothetical protein
LEVEMIEGAEQPVSLVVTHDSRLTTYDCRLPL